MIDLNEHASKIEQQLWTMDSKTAEQIDVGKQLEGMVNEMLDYFECPYFANAFIELWQFEFEGFLAWLLKGFKAEY